MNEHQLSRREWFRLGRSPKKPSLGHDQPADGDAALQPVEHPPNHDGLDLSTLPPMREATLALRDIESLFADIEQFGTDVTLMQRGNRRAHVVPSSADTSRRLEVARTALVSGQTKRLQIRYRWQDAMWIDTLESQPDGYRLVRIVHQNI